MMNPTNYLFKTLEKQGVAVSPWVEQAYARALAQASIAEGPLYIPFDKNNISFIYIPGTGPALVLNTHSYEGAQGTVRKVLTADKVLGLKTVEMVWGNSLERFEREVTALNKLGLLTWVEHPDIDQNGDVGVLIFPFYEGMTLNEYVNTHTTYHHNYKIALQVLMAFRELHFGYGIYHNDWNDKNIMVTETHDDLKVNVIDFGSVSFAENKYKTPGFDIMDLTEIFTELFNRTKIYSPSAKLLQAKFMREWGTLSEKYDDAAFEDRKAFAKDFEALEACLEALIAYDLLDMSKENLIESLWYLLLHTDEKDPRLAILVDVLVTKHGAEALDEKKQLSGNSLCPGSLIAMSHSPLSFCRTVQQYAPQRQTLEAAVMKYANASNAPVRFSVAPAAGPAEDNHSLNRNVL